MSWNERQAERTCNRCGGTGHDKGGRPTIEVRKVKDKSGKYKRKHTTVHVGSGCLKCQGLGVFS